MKPEIKYIELKSGHGDSGPAWIGLASFSKSGKTIYFNNKAFYNLGGSGVDGGNYADWETREEYWISSPKKNMADRHTFGSGKIFVEKRILDDYLKIVGKTELPKNKYEVVTVDLALPKERINEVANETLKATEHEAAIFQKTPKELSKKELEFLINKLNEVEENSPYKKAKRLIQKKRAELKSELESR